MATGIAGHVGPWRNHRVGSTELTVTNIGCRREDAIHGDQQRAEAVAARREVAYDGNVCEERSGWTATTRRATHPWLESRRSCRRRLRAFCGVPQASRGRRPRGRPEVLPQL